MEDEECSWVSEHTQTGNKIYRVGGWWAGRAFLAEEALMILNVWSWVLACVGECRREVWGT